MDIVGVDTAVFGVEDLDAARNFCRDYGLKEVEHGAAGASFEAQDGTGVSPAAGRRPIFGFIGTRSRS